SASYCAGPSILPMARLLAKIMLERRFGMATKEKQKKKKQKKSATTPTHVAAAQPETKETRQALMLKAKERGIKNFRVLNKNELMHILADGITQQEIDALVAGAVARWKSGWGSRKVKNENKS
ncbi:MAG: hypothetical protein JW994_04195, partial [Candidatus Omnitrophica bacterium]|nr:hypothetical protein [Candidatus Omnitrophota bacterium]